jgi:hypothetical protein
VTRREVLIELIRIGVTEPHLLKRYCRDFESYIKATYRYEICRKERKAVQSAGEQPIRVPNRSFCSASKKEGL